MANVPEDLHYSKDHEWIRVEGDTGTVGITDHAQHSLGDVVYVELPKVGETLRGARARSARSSRSRPSRRCFCPVGGRGRRGQRVAQDEPEKVNTRPVRRGLDDPRPHGQPRRGRQPALGRRVRRLHQGGDGVREGRALHPELAGRARRRCCDGLGLGSAERAVRLDPGRRPASRGRSTRRLRSPRSELLERFEAMAAQQRGRPPPELSRRGRLLALRADHRRQSHPALRVLHRLHALPARNLAGHAASHLRVPDACLPADGHGRRQRLDVRRLDRDGRGRA